MMEELILLTQDGVTKLNKKVIIAICGKSSSGKTTLANDLYYYFKELGIKVHHMVSFTTRPPRAGEKEGLDYCFVSDDIFKVLQKNGSFIESTCFNGWYYGTGKFSALENHLNIGVFNPAGMESLAKMKDEFIIVPIYLKANCFTRLFRSIKREKKLTKEMLRRMVVDHYDFKDLSARLKPAFKIPPLVLDTKIPLDMVFLTVSRYCKLCLTKDSGDIFL